jgi:hypothetical protein
MWNVGASKVRGHARQARGLRRQIEQGDLPPVARGDVHRAGEILRDRIVEADFTAGHHVREGGRGEDLRDGADLEDIVAANANRDDAPSLLEQSDDNSLSVLAGVGEGVDACQQYRVDGGVG